MKDGMVKSLADVTQHLRSPTLVSFLDMARWIAAALVFVAHLRNPLFLGYGEVPAAHRTLTVQAWYFVTGWHAEAVTVFFVLSGLLVGGAGLARMQAGSFQPASYAIDRVTRLYLPFLPALLLGYALDVLGSSFMAEVGFWNHAHPMVAQKVNSAPFASSLSADTLLGNILMLQHYFVPPAGSNQPLWTISAEFWFYAVFLFAALAGALARTPLTRAVSLVLMAGVFAVLGPKFLVLFGLWSIGVAVAFVPQRRWQHPLPAVLVFMAVLIAARVGQGILDTDATYRELKNYAVALAFAHLLVSLRGRRYAWLERVARPNAFFASFSYSLYLLHFPLMLFVLALMHATGVFPGIAHGFNPADPRGIVVYALTIILVFALCWLFSLATEGKTENARRFLKKRLSAAAPHPSPRY